MSFHGDFLKHHNRLVQLLHACSRVRSFGATKALHALNITMGLSPKQPCFIYNNIMSQYSSLGKLSAARRLFDTMPHKNIVSYNIMISAYSMSGYDGEAWKMLYAMMVSGFEPTQYAVSKLLSCSSLDICHGLQLHSLVIKNGLFGYNAFVGTSLLGFYGRHGMLEEAVWTFQDMPCRSLVTWNSIISLFGNHGFFESCVSLFRELVRKDVDLSEGSFMGVFSAFSCPQDLEFGEQLHAFVIKNGFTCEILVMNSLTNMYVKCSAICLAEKVFEEVQFKDVVSWNTVIGAVAKIGEAQKAVELFTQMSMAGVLPTEITFVSLINCCTRLEISISGESVHAKIIQHAHESNVFIASNGLLHDVPSNAIAGIYNRTGQYNETLRFLCPLEEHDIVSWNIVITALCRIGNYREVFELFQQMHSNQVWPDNYTFVGLLSVCAKRCDLALGSSLHAYIIKTSFSSYDTFACNVLLDMYGKCGSIGSSEKIFDEMRNQNLITWTAFISALGVNGYVHEALERFRKMILLGFRPDGVAFTAVLTACRHGGLVREGLELFKQMVSNYGVEPKMDHYQCVVDLLVKSGHVTDAKKVISSMPFPPSMIIWRCFLEGCKSHGTVVDMDQAVALAHA